MATRRPRRPPHWVAERSTGDLLVLMIASTVCLAVLAGGFALGAVTIFFPERNTVPGLNAISDVVSTLIGLLAGFLAGRTDAHNNLSRDLQQSQNNTTKAIDNTNA